MPPPNGGWAAISAQQNLSPTLALSAPALAAFIKPRVRWVAPTLRMVVPWRFDSARGRNREACRWSDYSSDTAEVIVAQDVILEMNRSSDYSSDTAELLCSSRFRAKTVPVPIIPATRGSALAVRRYRETVSIEVPLASAKGRSLDAIPWPSQRPPTTVNSAVEPAGLITSIRIHVRRPRGGIHPQRDQMPADRKRRGH